MMRNLARQKRQRRRAEVLWLVPGVVVDAEAPEFTVETDECETRARRAVSCLVEPERGDRVLVTLGETESWIVAVLERDALKTARITLDSDLKVVVRKGRLAVTAAEGVDLASGRDLNLAAAEVNLTASRGLLKVGTLSYLGSLAQAEVKKVRVLAESLDSVLDRVYQRAKRSYRFVEELERLKVGQLDYSAEDNLHLHGRNSLVTAEKLVKVDGDQIHLG